MIFLDKLCRRLCSWCSLELKYLFILSVFFNIRFECHIVRAIFSDPHRWIDLSLYCSSLINNAYLRLPFVFAASSSKPVFTEHFPPGSVTAPGVLPCILPHPRVFANTPRFAWKHPRYLCSSLDSSFSSERPSFLGPAEANSGARTREQVLLLGERSQEAHLREVGREGRQERVFYQASGQLELQTHLRVSLP